MNHWQEIYLNLKEQNENQELEDLDRLEKTKDISNSIGDLMSFLRGAPNIRIEKERNVDFETLISTYGNPKSLFIKSDQNE